MCDSDQSGELDRLRRRVAELENLAASQRAAAAALEVGERRFRSLIENMRGMIFYRGPREGDTWLYGVEVEDIAGDLQTGGPADLDAWHAAIHPDDRDRYLELERRRRTCGEGFTIEFRIARPASGRLIWARERAWVVTTPDDQWFNESYIMDVTAEKDQERRLREVSEAAQIANRSKSEFLANMSHELREGIMDVGAIIHRALRVVRARAHRKGITITTDLAPHLPQLRGDERRLRQILVNLLSNAVKFTPDGGRMTVVAGERPDGGLTFVIADTGIGMAEKDIPRAFEPFEQIHTGLDRLYEGTGLGLALSRRLSAPGQGTRAMLKLPPGRSVRLGAVTLP